MNHQCSALPPALKGVELRLVKEEDANFILGLRTNPSLNKFMSDVPPDVEHQRLWLRNYKVRETAGTEYYFIIMLGSKPTGTIRAYDFRDGSFSWGSWIVASGSPYFVALASCILIYDFCFGLLGFHSSHFEVRQGNSSVVRFHQRAGATLMSSDQLNHYFTMERVSFDRIRPRLISILRL